MTPLCFASLHLHQVGGGTFTLPDKARARHARIRPVLQGRGAGKRLLEPASAGFSGKGFSQAPGPRGLKPPLEKDRKRPSGAGGEAADPGVNTGSSTLRARPLKRPPRKGHSADRFASDRWKSKFQIYLGSSIAGGLDIGRIREPPSNIELQGRPGLPGGGRECVRRRVAKLESQWPPEMSLGVLWPLSGSEAG